MDGLTPAPAPTPTGDVREKRKTSYGELRGADAVIALWFSETYGSSFFVARHAMRELTKRLTAAGFTIRPEAGTVTIPLKDAKNIERVLRNPVAYTDMTMLVVSVPLTAAIAAAAPDTGEDGADS